MACPSSEVASAELLSWLICQEPHRACGSPALSGLPSVNNTHFKLCEHVKSLTVKKKIIIKKNPTHPPRWKSRCCQLSNAAAIPPCITPRVLLGVFALQSLLVFRMAPTLVSVCVFCLWPVNITEGWESRPVSTEGSSGQQPEGQRSRVCAFSCR